MVIVEESSLTAISAGAMREDLPADFSFRSYGDQLEFVRGLCERSQPLPSSYLPLVPSLVSTWRLKSEAGGGGLEKNRDCWLTRCERQKDVLFFQQTCRPGKSYYLRCFTR